MPDPGSHILPVLIVEDNADDAELMLRQLRLFGFAPQARRVQSEADFVAALEAGAAPGQPWDVILADYALPGFSGPRVLELVQARGADIPVIVLSGVIGEVRAAQIIKAGASDYLLKERLERLGPVVQRALEERRLRQVEGHYQRLFENAVVGLYKSTPDGRILAANAALAEMLGYASPADLLTGLNELGRPTYVDPRRRAEFQQRMEQAGEVSGFESEQYRMDGSTLWVSESARAVRDAQGRVLSYEGFLENISARKGATEALRESEQHYRLLFEDNPLPMWVYDLDSLAFLAVNDAAVEHYGYSRDEFLRMTIRDIRPPAELDQLQHNLARRDGTREHSGPWRHCKKSGELIWVEINSNDMLFAGRLARLVLANDVSEREAAALAVRESEARYRGLFADSPIALWEEDFSAVRQRLEALRQAGVSDMRAYLHAHPDVVAECSALIRILDVNQTAVRRYGARDADELIHNLGRIFSKASSPTLEDELCAIAAGQAEFHLETINHTLDGHALNISLNWAALPGHEQALDRVIVSTVDITDRKQAQEAMAHSERRFRALIENSSDGIALIDRDGLVLYTSPTAGRIMGGTAEEWIGGNFLNRVHPDEAQSVARLLAHLAAQPGARLSAEFRYRRRDESWCWLEATAANMLAEPSVGAIVVNYRDITERRQAQDALRASEARLAAIFRASPVGIALSNLADGRFVDVNQAFERLLGYTRAEIIGHTVNDLNLYVDSAQRSGLQAALLAHGRLDQLDLNVRRRSGAVMQSLASLELLELGSEQYVLGLFMDMTDRRQAEAALAQEHNLLRTLIDNLPDAIYVKDTQGRFVIKNLADARKMGAASPEETIGKTDFDFYPAELAARYHADDMAVIESGRAILNREEPITEASGRTGWVSTTKVPLRAAEGGIIGLVGIGHDVTERRLSEESLRRSQNDLETAQALAHLGSWSRSASSTLTQWSKEMFRLHGLPLSETAPAFDEFLETVRPADQPALLAALQAVEQGTDSAVCVYRTRPAQGPERVLELHLHVARGAAGELSGWHGTVQDITEQQRRLAELEAVNRLSGALRAAKHLDDLLERLLDEALSIVNGSAGSVWLFEPATDEVRLAVERGWSRQPPPFKRGQGVPGYVVASGQPYVSRELRNDPRMPASVRDFVPAGRGGVCVPIRADEDITGALYLNTELPREFSAEDVHLLTTLAEIAGIAMQRTRLHDETEQRLGQLTALREIDRAIMGSLDLRLTLDILLEQVTARLGVEAAAVLLFDEVSASLSFGAARGFRTRAITQTRLRLGENYAGQAALERRVVQADLSQAGPVAERARLPAAEGFVSYVGAPLVTKGQLRGVLEVFHRTPLQPSADWLSFLEALAGQAAIAVDNATLFARLERSNLDLQLAYDATIEGWSRALDLRDKETEGHSRRVTEMTEALAQQMGLSDEALVHLRRGALLHDIGKMGVPDGILLKPGPLNDDEWVIMRQHPRFAFEMISPIGYLAPALDIPYCHHEKWDGSGYPRGLKGEQIPLAARLFAVVDVWDALRSNRPYRPAWPASKVREHLRAQAGQHFDPAVVEVFLDLHRDD